MDTGDHVVVIKADKVELSGNKAQNKFAYRHAGYPGGITGFRYADLLATRPVAAVEKAIRGMLPKNRLGRQQIKKLHVVAGPEHPHSAQKPLQLAVGERPIWSGLPAAVPVTHPAGRTGATSPPSRKPGEAAPVEEGAPTTKRRTLRSAAPKSPAKKRAAAKPAAKKEPAASGAKRSAAAKTSAKKTTVKKPAASTTAAKKPTAKKTTAKKSAAKKPAKAEE
jgi:hypothetical protein